MQTYEFPIAGITCQKCVAKITAALSEVEAFRAVRVLRQPDRVEIDAAAEVSTAAVDAALQALQRYRVAKPRLLTQLFPLLLVFAYLLLTVALVALLSRAVTFELLMSTWMGAFFLVFSFFKFLNLRGFVAAFRSYDPIAMRWPVYGYLYASLELSFGIAYLFVPRAQLLNITVLLVLGISSWGVLRAVNSGRTVQCACLGTIFNLPMTWVTLVENALMLIMAAMLML